jgi:metallo-beta-lactamase class B
MTSAQSAAALRTGKLSSDDPQFILHDESQGFPAALLVEEIEDGDSMSVGDTRIRANYTPGHTPGGITWSWQSCEAHRCLSLVYADSLSAVSSPGFKFSKGGSDGVGETLRRSIELVAKLDCDIFLAPHPFYFDLQKKSGEQGGSNPFVDPQGCREYADAAMAGLNRRLKSEL